MSRKLSFMENIKSMKNINYIISGILAVAIIALFVLQLTGNKGEKKSQGNDLAFSDSISFHLPLAYVNTDSLLSNYNFYKDLSDDLMKKFEEKKLIIKQREDKIRREIINYQEKVNRNIFLSRESVQQEENRLLGLQQDLEKYAASVEQELTFDQMKMNQQLQDTIKSAIKDFNIPKKYEMIISNVGTDNILYADDSYDITAEVIEFLNARYVPPKK